MNKDTAPPSLASRMLEHWYLAWWMITYIVAAVVMYQHLPWLACFFSGDAGFLLCWYIGEVMKLPGDRNR